MTITGERAPEAVRVEPTLDQLDRLIAAGARRPPADQLVERALHWALLGIAVVATLFGALSLSLNSLDLLRLPLTGLMAVGGGVSVVLRYRRAREWSIDLIVLSAGAAVAFIVLAMLDEYVYGYDIDAIMHRSLFTAILLLGIGVPMTCAAAYRALGSTPSAYDISRYPLFVVPVAIALFLYGAMLAHLLQEGLPNITLDTLRNTYNPATENGELASAPGLRNYLLGTMLLVGLTAAIALPIGVWTGVFVAEYPGWIAKIVDLSAQMLRAISVVVLGATAFGVTTFIQDNPENGFLARFSDAVRGYQVVEGGVKLPGHGSYLLAATFLSLLVIPVIAKATEQGLRSVPPEFREGSVALGAGDGYGLRRILLPWSYPNIITALLLGCAEAAGSVAVILFIAGTGEGGVGPFREATSLGYLIYRVDAEAGKAFRDNMKEFQFTAALLLLFITFSLSVAALLLKQRFSRRYRGAITGQ